MLFYSLTIFLSAFLLFEVQPVIAKMILPWFGGSSAVWSTCMLFFQIVLLLGYLYAHCLNKLAPRKQAVTHIGLLVASLAALPIIPNEHWRAESQGHPSLTILALLAVTVGLPYFLLSSTSPLLQAWYARTHSEGLPYRLFALSNFSSMLALLTYPFVVEPNLPSHMQALVWSGGFVGFAAICGWTAWRTNNVASAPVKKVEAGMAANESASWAAPGWTARLLWLGLAASASILLLAVTTHLTQDVAAIPFLWIVPLTVYLLSFILCFEIPRFYQRMVFVPLLIASLAFMAHSVWPYHKHIRAPQAITLLAISLFVCCMVCHGELSRLKPHPRYLTSFYVTISLGGAIGGLFVGLVAPNLFHAYYEFPIGLAMSALVLAVVFTRFLWRDLAAWKSALIASVVVLLGAAICYGLDRLEGAFGRLLKAVLRFPLFTEPGFEFGIALAITILLLSLAFLPALRQVGMWRRFAGVSIAVMLGGFLYFNSVIMREMVGGYRVAVRNFYGQLRVSDEGDPRMDEDAARKLIHGVINHGEQFLRPEHRRQPVTYFCPGSGIGRGMAAQEGKPRRIGILGLGCGTLAAYGRPGDTLRIYEINPQVLEIANSEFTYLKDTPAKVEVALGDGRLLLDSEPSQQFDMLVMDAFSGDSVPVHLITREAFATYFRHLKPDGILAVNISNAYLNLEPVMERASNAFGKLGLVYSYTPEDETFCFGCTWTLIMNRSVADAHPELLRDVKILKPQRPFRIWTDDFSNMFNILK
jgi:hypothetical protein